MQRGHHPDEGRDVRAWEVAVRAGLLRRPGLAGDGVAGDRGELRVPWSETTLFSIVRS